MENNHHMDISQYISMLKYDIPISDSICFFSITDNNQNIEFFSFSQFIEYYQKNQNMQFDVFMPITPNKILTSSTKMKKIIENMPPKELIGNIVATSYDFFIASNNTFENYIHLIGEKNTNNLLGTFFINGLLTDVTDPLQAYFYRKILLKLRKATINKLNYPIENKDTDNIDIISQFLN